MKFIAEFLVTYLVLYGMILAIPLFLLVMSVPAFIVGWIAYLLGASETVITVLAFITVFLGIYVNYTLWSGMRMKKMEEEAAGE